MRFSGKSGVASQKEDSVYNKENSSKQRCRKGSCVKQDKKEDDELETTFVLLKPDAFERALVGDIIARFERKGLKLVRAEMRVVSKELAARHYAHLVGKPFYPKIEAFITRGPVLATAWRGRDAIDVVRRLVGATDAALAEPGTIRGDWACLYTENLVHASDSPDAARRELANFFPNDPEFGER